MFDELVKLKVSNLKSSVAFAGGAVVPASASIRLSPRAVSSSSSYAGGREAESDSLIACS